MPLSSRSCGRGCQQATEVDAPSGYDLPKATNIWLANHIAYNGGQAYIEVRNWSSNTIRPSYSFSPRQNYTQGEVTNSNDWIGGGSGESFTMYY